MNKKDLKFYARFGDKKNGVSCPRCRCAITSDTIQCPRCSLVFTKRKYEMENDLPRSTFKKYCDNVK